jgi:nucleoside 2-deoxyribosyltransferase
MKISGRRIHLAASANPKTPQANLDYGHRLITAVCEHLALAGAGFVLSLGKDPRSEDPTGSAGLPFIFDWTVADTLARLLAEKRISPTLQDGPLIVCITTHKTVDQIPPDRLAVWEQLLSSGALDIRQLEGGWTSGAMRRQMQAPLGDVLLCMSGGEGVEHLATQYAIQTKPIIPLDLALGSSSDDGRGGAVMLADKMRAHPERFVRLNDPHRIGALLLQMQTRNGQRPVEDVAAAVLTLLEAIAAPTVFYVRMLNRTLPAFAEVERYFREVVDPVVRERGHEPYEMGTAENTDAWMNSQIFEQIRQSALCVVDLTDSRPNCLIELGYACGLGKRVIITARSNTHAPFDIAAIEHQPWDLADTNNKLINDLNEYWRRNANRPPLALPPSLL